ncbi:extracellular solute-binding protein [Labrys monachus]|uniref:Multiple sugar transport system substrate-binding protein n=1 Tax=Labrys monachus TaxID=217067 RepID=A0ABU0FHT5_9HYPH|nr:extracellular solute-binding protein [Labrys monachus]MDQ0393902.1 multiple sugar transport system substrate-binding protein [Labrys monachus]
MSIKLQGMTWSHPRGYDPMVAVSATWKERTGVEIAWDKRSLQDFESYPVEDLAARYDFIVIDHPHVGQITHEKCLLPLDVPGREAERAALRAGSVGKSYDSYTWQGRQWAFPIDAAAQVQAYRPDRLGRAVRRWDDVMALARQGRVAIPLRPPHSLMSFYTLAAHIGEPCHDAGPLLIGPATGVAVLERLRTLAALVDPRNFEQDPIAVLEDMAAADAGIDCVPLTYGYVPYARDGFRAHRVGFGDIPVDGDLPPRGSALGGTGIAVSARTQHPQAALDFAYFIASGAVQEGIFARSGGQPGHDLAWRDAGINADTHDFYRDTRATLEAAWVRPRHDGYMPFQHAASELINDALLDRASASACVSELNRLFAASQESGL